MLAGMHPFKKDTGMDTAGAILKDAPQSLGDVRADTPSLLQHIVKKMLAKDRRDRYQSIHEVQTDLKELLEDSDRPAPATGRRLKSLYWLAATALVVVGAGTWAFLRFYPREAALPPPRIVPVTTSGAENPSLSPGGNWVAYHWKGEKEANSHIWNAKPVAIMCFYDFATRRVRNLAPMQSGPAFQPEAGLSVSLDGKWLVYSGGFGTQDVRPEEFPLGTALPLGRLRTRVPHLGSVGRLESFRKWFRRNCLGRARIHPLQCRSSGQD